MDCPSSCTKCSWNPYKLALSCAECAVNFQLQDSMCVKTCSAGQYPINDNGTPACKDCPASCEGCKFDPRALTVACLGCKSGFVREDGNPLCVEVKSDCTAGKFAVLKEGKQACVDCPITCSACSMTDPTDKNSFKCTTCKTGNVLSGASCVKDLGEKPSCTDTQTLTMSGGAWKCINCPKDCAKCFVGADGAAKCGACNEGFVVNPENGSCMKPVVCTAGKFSLYSPD